MKDNSEVIGMYQGKLITSTSDKQDLVEVIELLQKAVKLKDETIIELTNLNISRSLAYHSKPPTWLAIIIGMIWGMGLLYLVEAFR